MTSSSQDITDEEAIWKRQLGVGTEYTRSSTLPHNRAVIGLALGFCELSS